VAVIEELGATAGADTPDHIADAVASDLNEAYPPHFLDQALSHLALLSRGARGAN
jgi:hypothetical protein